MVPLATLPPFTLHVYTGAGPPFTAVAVNVTGVPEQEGFSDGLIVTDGITPGITVTVIGLEVAGVPVAQVKFDVKRQVTTFPFEGV